MAEAAAQKEKAKQVLRSNASGWAEANTLLQQAVSKNPKDAEARFLLGLTFYNLRNYPAAIDHLQASFDLDQNNIQALLVKGNAYRDMRDTAKAEATYRDIMKRAPDFVQAYTNLALMFEEMGRPKDALAALELGAAKANPNPDLFQLLGEQYREARQNDKARAAFERALQIDPNRSDIKDALNKLK